MEMVSSKEGEAADAAALLMLRRETKELAEQVSKNLQEQLREELQGFLKQLQATLTSHSTSNGCSRGSHTDDELRRSGLILQPEYSEPPLLDTSIEKEVLNYKNQKDSIASDDLPTTGSNKAPMLHVASEGDESSWLFRHRRGYLAGKEISLVKSENEHIKIGAREDGFPEGISDHVISRVSVSMDNLKVKVKNYMNHPGAADRASASLPGTALETTQEEGPLFDVQLSGSSSRNDDTMQEASKKNRGSVSFEVSSERRKNSCASEESWASSTAGHQRDSSVANGSDAPYMRDTGKTELMVSRESKVFYHTSKSNQRRRGHSQRLLTTQRLTTGPRLIAARVVNSIWFDAILGMAIVTNAICIGLQADWNVKNRGEEVPTAYRAFDLVFCSIFMVELCLRLYVYRLRFYSMRGWGWNMFDTFVVLAQVLEEALLVFASTFLRNVSFMRIMRVFRLIRIIRLVRILRIIGELRLLVLSIVHSLKSLGWTIVLIVLMMYINAIWLTQVVADETDGSDELKIFYYYGSLVAAILSLFQSITGGIDWDDAMRPLVEEISPVWGFVYCLYIAFSVFAMLNVVTGVFVESALQSANEDKDIIMVNTMGEFFKKASGSTGTMSWEDFQRNLHTQHMKDYFKLIDIDVSEARAIFRLLDLNQSGEISVDEFLSGCVRLRGSAKAIDLAMLMHEVRRIEILLKNLERLQHFQLASRSRDHSHDSSRGRRDGATKVLLENSSAHLPPSIGVPLRHVSSRVADDSEEESEDPKVLS